MNLHFKESRPKLIRLKLVAIQLYCTILFRDGAGCFGNSDGVPPPEVFHNQCHHHRCFNHPPPPPLIIIITRSYAALLAADLVCHLSFVIRHPTSTIIHQPSSVVCHHSFVTPHPPSFIFHPSSVVRLSPSFFIRYLSSLICHPSSVVCRPWSVRCLSSVVRGPSSNI